MKYFYNITGWIIMIFSIIAISAGHDDALGLCTFAMIVFVLAELEEMKGLL